MNKIVNILGLQIFLSQNVINQSNSWISSQSSVLKKLIWDNLIWHANTYASRWQSILLFPCSHISKFVIWLVIWSMDMKGNSLEQALTSVRMTTGWKWKLSRQKPLGNWLVITFSWLIHHSENEWKIVG